MKQITLVRQGNLLYIRPWISGSDFDGLKDELQCVRMLRGPRGKITHETCTLYSIMNNEQGRTGLTYGGLFQDTLDYLRRRGYQVKVVDKQKRLPEPCLDNVPPLRTGQPEAIAAICSAVRGIIACPTAFGKSFVLRVLCGMFKDSRIVVVSRRKRVVQELYNRITEAYDEPVARLFSPKPSWPDDARIVVTTTRSLHKVHGDWPDIVLFDEVHNAAAPDVAKVLTGYTTANMFGLSATPEGRGDGADRLIRAFFGEKICEISYQDAVKEGTVSQITAVFCDIKQPELDVRGMDFLQKNKVGYWRNEERNRLLLNEARRRFREDESVLYYVENTEHALFLRLLEPGLPIAHAGVSNKRWETFLRRKLATEEDEEMLKRPDLDTLEQQFKAGEIKRIICTSTWREGVDFPDLAGLVRLDGGDGDIPSAQIGGRLSRIGADGTKQNALLIDAYDDFGPRFLRRSQNRMRSYHKRGWDVRH